MASRMWASRSWTVAPVSQVPVTSGVLSLVVEPASGVVMVGAAGAVVSTVNGRLALLGLAFPAGSVCRAKIVWRPVVRADESQE